MPSVWETPGCSNAASGLPSRNDARRVQPGRVEDPPGTSLRLLSYQNSMSTRWTSFTLALALSMPARADDRAVQWRQDLTALAAELKSVHPRFRDCGLPADFKKRQTALGKRIGRLTDEQVLVEIQRLLASVGDGHTLMLPFGMKKGRLLHIPLMFWSFEEGLYVVDSPDHDLIGKRILRIGGIPAESVLSRLEPYVSHDNGEQVLWAAPLYATLTDFLAAVGATGDRGAAALTFDDGTGATIRAVPIDPALLREKLIAPKTAPAPLYLSRPEAPFWTAELSRDVLYVQVNAMSDGADETLAAFAISLRSRIPRFRAVILDLRLNNGGEAEQGGRAPAHPDRVGHPGRRARGSYQPNDVFCGADFCVAGRSVDGSPLRRAADRVEAESPRKRAAIPAPELRRAGHDLLGTEPAGDCAR